MKTRLVKQAFLFQLFHVFASGDEKLESDHPYPFDHTNQDYTQPAGMLNLGLGYIFDHSFGSKAYSVVRWFFAKLLEFFKLDTKYFSFSPTELVDIVKNEKINADKCLPSVSIF